MTDSGPKAGTTDLVAALAFCPDGVKGRFPSHGFKNDTTENISETQTKRSQTSLVRISQRFDCCTAST